MVSIGPGPWASCLQIWVVVVVLIWANKIDMGREVIERKVEKRAISWEVANIAHGLIPLGVAHR